MRHYKEQIRQRLTIFPSFSRIRTEYGEIRIGNQNSRTECEKMREKCGPE